MSLCSRSSSRDRKRSRWEEERERERRSESSSSLSRERGGSGGGGNIPSRGRESEEVFSVEREKEKGEEEKDEEELLLKPAWIRCTHAESYYSNDPMDQVVAPHFQSCMPVGSSISVSERSPEGRYVAGRLHRGGHQQTAGSVRAL